MDTILWNGFDILLGQVHMRYDVDVVRIKVRRTDGEKTMERERSYQGSVHKIGVLGNGIFLVNGESSRYLNTIEKAVS